jgi:hypothetical protein
MDEEMPMRVCVLFAFVALLICGCFIGGCYISETNNTEQAKIESEDVRVMTSQGYEQTIVRTAGGNEYKMWVKNGSVAKPVMVEKQ